MEPVKGAAGFGSDTKRGPMPYFWIAARERHNVEAVCHRAPEDQGS